MRKVLDGAMLREGRRGLDRGKCRTVAEPSQTLSEWLRAPSKVNQPCAALTLVQYSTLHSYQEVVKYFVIHFWLLHMDITGIYINLAQNGQERAAKRREASQRARREKAPTAHKHGR